LARIYNIHMRLTSWRPTRLQVLLAVLGIGLFAGGIGLGWVLSQDKKESGFSAIRQKSDANGLIDPLLYVTSPESDAFPTYSPLKDALTSYVNETVSGGRATDISIYFRDLNGNKWIGVNTDHKFALASMLKVATVLAVLRAGEEDNNIVATRITLDPKIKLTSQDQAYYPPANQLVLDEPYTIAELMWHQLVESDNDAETTLEAYIGQDKVKTVYNDLSLPIPANSGMEDDDTAQQYSRLFRVLYSATYLSRSDSQAVLDLLSRTTFDQGLVAGVPAGTTVAHKFGEAVVPVGSASTTTSVQVSGVNELHDCGIVYYPGHPYFLCVLTKGNDFPVLASVIKDVSALTWKQLETVNGH